MATSKKTTTGSDEKSCKVKGCKRPYRAKGYCNVHYQKWRRGDLPKARFDTCNHGVNKLKRGEKKECLKPVYQRGLCEEHYKAKFEKSKSAEAPAEKAEAAPASEAAEA